MTKTRPKISKRKCDELWSRKVKERDGYRCMLCGSTKNLNSHHIMKKGSHLLRYDLLNGITLDVSCHKFGIHSPDLDTATLFVGRLRALIGEERLEYLRKLKSNTRKLSLSEAWEELNK